MTLVRITFGRPLPQGAQNLLRLLASRLGDAPTFTMDNTIVLFDVKLHPRAQKVKLGAFRTPEDLAKHIKFMGQCGASTPEDQIAMLDILSAEQVRVARK